MVKRKSGSGVSNDAILLTLIKLITLLLGILVTRLLSQFLTPLDYGTYAQAMMLVSTVSNLTILGMIDGVNYFNCSEKDEIKREAYLATLFSSQCIVSAIAGVVIFMIGGAVCRYFDNPDLKRLLIFVAGLSFLQNTISMLQVLVVSIGKAKLLAIRNLVVSVVRLIAVISVVALVRNIAVILVVITILDLGQITVFAALLRKSGYAINIFHADFSLLKRIAFYCGPMAIFIAINSINRDLDKYLIAVVTNTETVALYANASKQLPFDIIMASFCTVLQPEITRLAAEGQRDKATPMYKLLMEIAYIPNVILCGAALTSAPQLMLFLYSDKYLSGLLIFCIYILVDLVRFSNMTLVLCAVGETKKVMLLGFCTIAMNASLNLLLYELLGLPGPAWATLITTGITGILMIMLSAKALRARLRAVIDAKYILKLILHGILTMVICIAFRTWLVSMDIYYIVVLLLTAGSYCLIMLLMHGKKLLATMREINALTKTRE